MIEAEESGDGSRVRSWISSMGFSRACETAIGCDEMVWMLREGHPYLYMFDDLLSNGRELSRCD